ncbi:MAG: sigma-70 family RNA polymerase sigma factor [Planctomycetes bacterium]|nr:sigma-70 family RNA polymerase sigma factor [Planctomycetota bacterium]
MESPLVPQVLLQHGQFVRALAHRLLRDGHAAEDVAQETWARYFARPPAEERGLRHWLRVVTRNVAVNRSRSERGRAAREALVARPEALPSAHEELEHGELLSGVVQAVLALDEPYRSTIVARYYRGLDAETIAQESGTTAATVRSREHRALEKLRERLDRHCQGERGAWAVALARFAGPASTVVVVTSAGGLGAKVAVGLLAVAGGVALWLREPATSEANLAPNVTSSPGPTVSAPVALAPVLPILGQRQPLGGDSSDRESASNTSLADIHGRFLFADGSSAADVALKLHGWGTSKEQTLLYGEPADWVDPSATSDAQGFFSLRFDPPRAFQFMLDAKAPGHAAVSWRWSGFSPDAVLDLGAIELPVGGAIDGRILDAEGRPVVGPGWRVVAETIGIGVMDGRDDTRVYAAADPSTGAFHLTDVWPGLVGLSADAPMTDEVRGPRVVAVSGQTVTADIVYTGPDFSHRIAVETSARPFYVMNDPDPAHVRLVASDGTLRTAGGRSPFVFDDLPAGFYTVAIDDPRYVPWSRTGVVPGEHVRVRLVGPAALRLAVADVGGLAIERFAVRLTFQSANFGSTQFEVHDGKEPLAGGLASGLFPGDYTVTVLTADGASASAEVVGLAAGETRSLAFQLAAVAAISGRVTHPDGAPATRAQLTLLASAPSDDSDMSPIQFPGNEVFDPQYWRRALSATIADENGEFRLVPPRPGTYLVQASGAPAAHSPHPSSASVRNPGSSSCCRAQGSCADECTCPRGPASRASRSGFRRPACARPSRGRPCTP